MTYTARQVLKVSKQNPTFVYVSLVFSEFILVPIV